MREVADTREILDAMAWECVNEVCDHFQSEDCRITWDIRPYGSKCGCACHPGGELHRVLMARPDHPRWADVQR